MNKKKVLVCSLVIVLAVSASVLFYYLKRVGTYKDQVAQMTISDVDLSRIQDGVYIGDCDVDLIYAKVAVTMQNGTIAAIDLLEHCNGKGVLAEAVIDEIVDQQKLGVDVVSGATNSSKVIQKAVEKALSGDAVSED